MRLKTAPTHEFPEAAAPSAPPLQKPQRLRQMPRQGRVARSTRQSLLVPVRSARAQRYKKCRAPLRASRSGDLAADDSRSRKEPGAEKSRYHSDGSGT